jgi:hypothetical protein
LRRRAVVVGAGRPHEHTGLGRPVCSCAYS